MLFICTELDYSLYIQNINALQKALVHPAYHRSWLQNWAVSRRNELSAAGDSDPSKVHCRGNCIPKQPRKFLCWEFEQVFDKNSAQCTLQLLGLCVEKRQMPCYSPTPHRGTVDTFDMHITRIKSLSRFHRCSDGLSSNKTFTGMEKSSHFLSNW